MATGKLIKSTHHMPYLVTVDLESALGRSLVVILTGGTLGTPRLSVEVTRGRS